jgi:hypothetical protein
MNEITMPRETAQIVFDALVHSLDFGSGFLDTPEVEALRGLAVALGVDPATATPKEFVKHYPHVFEPMPDDLIDREFEVWVNKWDGHRFNLVRGGGERPDYVPCKAGYPYCRKPETDPIHHA